MVLYRSILSLVVLASAAACGGSSQGTGTSQSALTGPMQVHFAPVAAEGNPLAASAFPNSIAPTQIVVTIDRVEAKVGDEDDSDGWMTLSLQKTTVDLMALPTNGFASLGVTQFPAGGLERLRIFLAPAGPDYVRTADGVSHTLVVPSDAIRIVGDFDAEECATGTVSLAISEIDSIAVHPANDGTGNWILRPVIRIDTAVVTPTACRDDDDQGDQGHHGDGDGHGHEN